MAITLRNTKGSALTFSELDTNFSDLNSLKAPLAAPNFTTDISVNNSGVGAYMLVTPTDEGGGSRPTILAVSNDGSAAANVMKLFSSGRVDFGPSASGFSIGSSGNITINAPSSGATLTLGGAAGNNAIETNYPISAPGVDKVYTKGSATTRTSTASLAADPDMTTSLGVGVFQIYIYVLVSGGAGGYSIRPTFSGTLNAAATGLAWRRSAIAGFVHGNAPLDASTQSFAVSSLSSSLEFIIIEGLVVTTGAGTFSVDWAQNSSNAAGTTFSAGSFLLVKRLI
jgi:hypothetical protein